MKLKKTFVVQDIEDTQFLVPVGADAFSGIVRSNQTAAFIVNCLKEETTEEEIAQKMCAKYDIDRGTVEKDIKKVLDTLRKINALKE